MVSNSRVPKIPSQPVTRKGVPLNRFYILRQGDTPNSVAQLIYGDASKATNLSKWNPGWKPGKVVYYSSPNDPQDGQMKSFYQERNIPSEEYVVKQGDWLSRIAQNKLGSLQSWKEIAIVNGMDTPDSIDPGQKLAIYPADLTRFSNESQTVAATEPPKQEPPKEEISTPPSQAEAPAQPPTQQVVPEEPPPIEPPSTVPADTEKKPGDFDIARLMQQEMFAVVMGAGILILLLALVFVNRRKKARQQGDDLGDDELSPPSKLKRK
jgi:hypothetical protein